MVGEATGGGGDKRQKQRRKKKNDVCKCASIYECARIARRAPKGDFR